MPCLFEKQVKKTVTVADNGTSKNIPVPKKLNRHRITVTGTFGGGNIAITAKDVHGNSWPVGAPAAATAYVVDEPAIDSFDCAVTAGAATVLDINVSSTIGTIHGTRGSI